MKSQYKRSLVLCTAAVTGAAYAVLTMVLAPISYGPLQFRLSEALCVLPFFIPSTAWGLFVGCAAANLMTGNVFDVVFGSLATLMAALCTAAIGKKDQSAKGQLLACLMPVLFNAVIIGFVITEAYMGLRSFQHPEVLALNGLQVGIGEAGVMFLVAFPLMRQLKKLKFFHEFLIKIN
ncbi:MAG: QueT transporter family protein [Oscillospiraceae bacterium]|nr:QueT transporter family protein [Oscillospiraceae bacterium]